MTNQLSLFGTVSESSNVVSLKATRGKKRQPVAQTKPALVVGQRVHSGLYGGRDGVIVAIHGEQRPETIGSLLGVISQGGNAEFDIVFDDGTTSKRLPESILHGVQWKIFDEVWTAEQVKQALLRAADYVIRKEIEGKSAAEAFAAEITRLKAEHPHMKPVNESNKGGVTATADNLRKHLKHTFPGVKFSVRSKSYTGGSLIEIEWTGGPTSAEVKAIGDKFELGNFDGMSDAYEFKKSPWTETFGGAYYVNTFRHDPAAATWTAPAPQGWEQAETSVEDTEEVINAADWAGEALQELQAAAAPACAHKRVKLVAGQGCTCRDCGASV